MGNQALHLAAENGAYEAVRVLSRHCRRRRGSIEYLAAKQGHAEVCKLLQRRWSGEPDSDDGGGGGAAGEGGGQAGGAGRERQWRVKALFDFGGVEKGDLPFRVGDVLVLTEVCPSHC
jgi:hypothetical protein